METKHFLLSKRFWGAAITLISATGYLSVYGITLDTDTWVVSIELKTLAAKLLAAGVPFGTVIGFWGAFVAKHTLRVR